MFFNFVNNFWGWTPNYSKGQMDPRVENIFKSVNIWLVDSEKKVFLRPVHEVGIQQQEYLAG
jgi:hypothetical protein